MRAKLIIVSILFLLFAILASQNTGSTELKFFFWSVWLPLIVMIVVVFILGSVIGMVFASIYERKKRKEEETISTGVPEGKPEQKLSEIKK
jgi:uncharacterized integral membrane protein